MKTEDEIRINLVLTRGRDKELFDLINELLRGVPDAHRAEVVRRQMAVWVALSKTRSEPSQLPKLTTRASIDTATARIPASRPANPPTPDTATAPTEQSGALYKSELAGVEMDLDFFPR